MSTLVMRHAPTPHNAVGTPDPKTEKVRGHGPIGLSPEGREIAKDAGEHLKGRAEEPTMIFTSDLPRAKETAEIIAHVLGNIPVVPSARLRTWDVGDITGQTVEQAKPQLDDLQHKKRTKPAPNGESYLTFFNRWSEALNTLRKIGDRHNVLVVVHGRQVYATPHVLSGKRPEGIPTSGPPHPGDILSVNETSKTLEPVYQSGSQPRVTA